MKKVLFVLCILVLQAPVFAQQEKATNLNDEEKAIIAYIDQNMPRAIALLKESVNINSGTLNIAGVKKVGEIFAREFEKANFKTKWVPMPDSLRRAGHLVASIGFNNEAENAIAANTSAATKPNYSKKKTEIAKTKKGKINE